MAKTVQTQSEGTGGKPTKYKDTTNANQENVEASNNTVCELTCKMCGTCPASFQCPLCQAEGSSKNGFYCSQSCFAKDWSVHRSSVHPSGRVKEKKRSENEHKLNKLNDESIKVNERELVEKNDVHHDEEQKLNEQESKDKKNCEDNSHARIAVKRTRNDADAAEEERNIFATDNTNTEMTNKTSNTFTLPIWTPIPSEKTCAQLNYAQITPPLPLECKRAIVLFNSKNLVKINNCKSKSCRITAEEEVKSSKDNQENVNQYESDSFNTQELIRHAMWPAITAMAHYLASYVKHVKEIQHDNSHITHEQIVIVTGDASSAFAMAWALRCAKVIEPTSSSVTESLNNVSLNTIDVKLHMRLNTESNEHCCNNNDNNNKVSAIQITIVSREVVRKYSVDSTVSFLFDSAQSNYDNNSNINSSFERNTVTKNNEMESVSVKKILITLPNVHDAMNLQGVDMSAIFVFAGCKKESKESTSLSSTHNVELNDEADSYVNCLLDNSNDEDEVAAIDTECNNKSDITTTTTDNSEDKRSKVKKNKKKSNCENDKVNTLFVHTLTGINSSSTNIPAKKPVSSNKKKKQYKENELLEEQQNSTANKHTTRINTILPTTWCDLPLRVTRVKQKLNNVAESTDNNNLKNELHLQKDKDNTCTETINNNECEIIEAENHCVRQHEACVIRFHDHMATSIASGDLNLFLEQLVSLYEQAPGKVEEILYNILCCDRPALHVTHAHHRMAYILRHCARVSFARASMYSSRITRFEDDNNTNNNNVNNFEHYVTNPNSSSNVHGNMDHSLFGIALRVIVKLCKLLPPLYNNNSSNPVSDNNYKNNKSDSMKNESRECNEQQRSLATPSAAELQRYYNYYNLHEVNNLQLQATLAFIYPMTSEHVLDRLAAAWDVHMVIPSIRHALANSPERRKQAAERIRLRYGSKFDIAYVQYLIALMLILYDTVAIFGMSVAELETRLQWTLSGMRADIGDLKQFLIDCLLLQEDKQTSTQHHRSKNNNNKTNTLGEITSLSSRLTSLKTRQPSRSELTRSMYSVRLPLVNEYKPLPFQVLPIAQHKLERRRQQELSAMEEILMVMPVDPRPIYIGEVGNRLGKWIHFNAKYNGQLGVSLSEFMMRHPEHFKVVGTLVTRITRASNTIPIKIRYDNDENVDYLNKNGNHSDVDEDEGDAVNARAAKKLKVNDRALLTGQRGNNNRHKQKNKSAEEMLNKLPSRTRRKRAKKAANAARFNKNYKPFDKSAHVPGYVKHGPRKIKGRGKKPNKRLHKRS